MTSSTDDMPVLPMKRIVCRFDRARGRFMPAATGTLWVTVDQLGRSCVPVLRGSPFGAGGSEVVGWRLGADNVFGPDPDEVRAWIERGRR